ncbi:MAG: NAD(P)-dependent glycerol-3-phosphate dehydrogenase [Alphaproteobacteria bacterium]|nr:NAD(P)-dependent glycerol-3-phosphate dehydrogenase [Alphaproteobacteria bacterium]MCW5740965.1 NAD(P)-dependent glycerol-3-phosphate dehydrogenase [Alphaproteobacteria bacterium]
MDRPGFSRIGIVGGGAWGTALAMTARRAGRDVTLWAREPEVVAEIGRDHRNTAFLPGHALDPAIRATADLAGLGADIVLLVTPAQVTRAMASELHRHLAQGVPVIICAKGIETATGALMPAAVGAAMPGRPVAMLSGPTFAEEVARGLPTAVTLACADAALGRAMAGTLATATFRPYWSDDLTGAALGGAVKNVLAIACGIADGRKLGDNARAAVLTRGFAEMARLGVAMGARVETMAGLAGLGDLTLTCNGPLSRNRSLGVAVGEGAKAADFLAARSSVAEGFYTAPVVAEVARRHDVEMPICTAVAHVLHHGADVEATIRALLARPLRGEGE